MVPPTLLKGTPCFSAVTRKKASKIEAGPLIVMETVTLSRGMPPKSTSISRKESIATPHTPTSPRDLGESESKPISVGK
ncbi:MAG: hypothetical protein ACD_73C00430G0001 [uncultured bacterium]|nr:MAG: hypothetical protein ACD_73C00430G0001 [uncultured bacterium]